MSVELDLAPGLPGVETSRSGLELVLFTLLQILLAAIPRTARSRHVRLATRRSGDGIEVTLAVTPLALWPDAGACSSLDGTAVGLGMCRSVLRNHGGDLSLRDAAAGTTFVATLPVLPKESADD